MLVNLFITPGVFTFSCFFGFLTVTLFLKSAPQRMALFHFREPARFNLYYHALM